jgi:hypothetical protein
MQLESLAWQGAWVTPRIVEAVRGFRLRPVPGAKAAWLNLGLSIERPARDLDREALGP